MKPSEVEQSSETAQQNSGRAPLAREQGVRERGVDEQLWKDPDWTCPHCRFVNFAIRQKCRNCRYDSNAGEFPWYNPLPPYDGLPMESDII